MNEKITLQSAYELLQMPEKPDFQTFEAAHQAPVHTSIRKHPKKDITLPQGRPVAWNDAGWILNERPLFAKDPLWHAGAYYVQESSSMFLRHAFKNSLASHEHIRVLDLCAAPGGKSTDIASILSDDSLLISNEIIPSRNNILCENITRWGQLNTWVTQMEPKQWQKTREFFDCIIIDAPCTGSGLWKRDPQALQEWSVEAVEKCAVRQASIIEDVLPALKPGGIILYSTCSFSSEENEAIVDVMIEQHGLISMSIPTQEDWGIDITYSPKHAGTGYRFSPWKVAGEGFFLACFKKPGELKENLLRPSSNKQSSPAQAYFNVPIHTIIQKDETIAIPATLASTLSLLQASQVYFKKVGTKVGTWMKNSLIPDHELALSIHLQSPYDSIELSLSDALEYLRKNNLENSDNLQGWKLVQYNHIALGWSKWMPGRMNNYYPKNWRLLNH